MFSLAVGRIARGTRTIASNAPTASGTAIRRARGAHPSRREKYPPARDGDDAGIARRIFSFNAGGASKRNDSSLSRARIAAIASYSPVHLGHPARCRSNSTPVLRSSSSSRKACISTRASSQFTSSLLCDSLLERTRELAAGARQPRHHRADRHVDSAGDFLVRQVLDIAHHDYLAKIVRQLFERLANRRRVSLAHRVGLHAVLFGRSAVHLFVELSWWIGAAIAPQPAERGVAHDRENPGARVAAAKSRRKPKSAQVRLLHHVLCVVIVTHQPSRKVVRSVHMRQEGAVEVGGFGFVRQ